MPARITFIVTTQDDKGRSGSLSEVNSHTATCAHERRRAETGKPRKTPRRSTARKAPWGTKYQEKAPTLYTDEDADVSSTATSSEDDSVSVVEEGHDYASWYTGQYDQQLASSLDPFLKLPAKVSQYEKHLVHLYLSDFRTVPNNTCQKPRFCPTLEFAYKMIETNKVYTYTHIALSEYLIAARVKRKESALFYHGKAEAYKAMNELLNTEGATINDKMLGFCQIAIMEWITGTTDLKIRHVHAMDLYLEERGGISKFLATLKDPSCTLDPSLYTCVFTLAPLLCPTAQIFFVVSNRFIRDLTLMRDWSMSRSSKSAISGGSLLAPHIQALQGKVRKYCEWLVKDNLGLEDSYGVMSASMCFLHSLSLSLALYEYGIADSYLFLEEVGMCMEQSEPKDSDTVSAEARKDPKKSSWMAPIAAYALLGHVRGIISPKQNRNEIAICQASIDMLRMLPYIEMSIRIQLGYAWLRHALFLNDQSSWTFADFDDDRLEQLRTEMFASWARSHMSQK